MKEIGLDCRARAVGAHAAAGPRDPGDDRFPCVIRPSFTMGGSGGGIAYNREEFEQIVERGLDASPTAEVLIEESVIGWKEFEMEVVATRTTTASSSARSKISIPWAYTPVTRSRWRRAQTLTDKEYQRMRNASIAVLRKIGVENGGSNVQFAVNPQDGRLLVIEMNPRVSRSSALASKGHGIPDRQDRRQARRWATRSMNSRTTSRRCDAGFLRAHDRLRGHQDSPLHLREIPGGEFAPDHADEIRGRVMAIGRTFQESLQKAIARLETGLDGPMSDCPGRDARRRAARQARLRVARAGARPPAVCGRRVPPRAGHWNASASCRTSIRGFLAQIENWSPKRRGCASEGLSSLDAQRMRALKRKGFSDSRLHGSPASAKKACARSATHRACTRCSSASIPCAAEFATSTSLSIFDLRGGVRSGAPPPDARS